MEVRACVDGLRQCGVRVGAEQWGAIVADVETIPEHARKPFGGI